MVEVQVNLLVKTGNSELDPRHEALAFRPESFTLLVHHRLIKPVFSSINDNAGAACVDLLLCLKIFVVRGCA